MEFTIKGENTFKIPSNSFAISPSDQTYTLNYSADGINFTEWEDSTPSGENLVVTDAPLGLIFKLVGNNSELTAVWK